MRALIDTCIIIDAMQNREPFAKDAQNIFLMAANNRYIGYITANSVSDIYYIMHRFTHSDKESRLVLSKLFTLFDVADTMGIDCLRALPSPIKDYEDALIEEAALRSEIDCIITRNVCDFEKSNIPIYTPDAFINKLAEESDKD
ncbi:MAG: PIN domain-containing protein [Clostridia bacterium]|nr:PIN domain-containing protein [Clostridia bacterium]